MIYDNPLMQYFMSKMTMGELANLRREVFQQICASYDADEPTMGLIEYVLLNMTVDDLINLKFSVFENVIAAFARHYEQAEGLPPVTARERAIAHYRELQDASYTDANGNRGTGNLQKLKTAPDRLTNMKISNRVYLGLDRFWFNDCCSQ